MSNGLIWAYNQPVWHHDRTHHSAMSFIAKFGSIRTPDPPPQVWCACQGWSCITFPFDQRRVSVSHLQLWHMMRHMWHLLECLYLDIWLISVYPRSTNRLTTQMRSHEHLLPFLLSFEAMRMETNHQHPWDLQHTSAVGMVTFLVSWSSHDPCPVSWWQGVCPERTAHCLPREWAGFPTEKRTGADSCPNWSAPMLGRISCLTILDGEHAYWSNVECDLTRKLTIATPWVNRNDEWCYSCGGPDPHPGDPFPQQNILELGTAFAQPFHGVAGRKGAICSCAHLTLKLSLLTPPSTAPVWVAAE